MINESTANSNGIYSLKNGWLKVPIKDDIPDVDLEPELSEWLNAAEDLGSIEAIDDFMDDIYQLRQESILVDGEYGKGNLIFKELRNRGILQSLKDKKVELENKEMSLESLKEEISDNISGFKNIEFYESNGKIPVADFIKNQPNKKLQAKIFRDIKVLNDLGINAKEPLVKRIENNLYELRSIFGNTKSRIFYFFVINNKIIMTNGYIKKQQDIDKNELKRAKLMRDDYLSRIGG